MYRVIDNFLSKEDFDLFSSQANKHSSSKWMTSIDVNNTCHWGKFIMKSQVDDLEKEVNRIFHPIIWKVTNLINLKINEEISNVPPLFSLGYLFAKNPYVVPPHIDMIYNNKKYYKPEYLTDSYSAFFYSHDYWDPNWGGYLGFHNDQYVSIEPKPNRLVFYSLNERHSVTQINDVQENPIRKIFKVSFYKITKERRHHASSEEQIDYTMEI